MAKSVRDGAVTYFRVSDYENICQEVPRLREDWLYLLTAMD